MSEWDFQIKKKSKKELPTQVARKKRHQFKNLTVEKSENSFVSRHKSTKKFIQKRHLENLVPASFTKRLIAFILDVAIFIALSYYLMTEQNERMYIIYKDFIFSLGMDQNISKPILLLYLQYYSVILSYFLVLIIPIFISNRSIGKSLLRLEIVHENVEVEISKKVLIFREFLKLLSIISVIGIFFLLLNDKRKTFYDFILKTIVV